MTAPITRGIVERGDIRIEVLAQGKGPLVVMIPSLGRPAEDFEDLSRRLADAGYCALRPQPRGIGKSSGPMHHLTLHDFSRDVAAVIEKFGGGPVGIDNLAAAISEERDTIEDVLEPYLIQQGYLQRTPRGRVATVSAYRHFGLAQPKSLATPDLWEEPTGKPE